MPISTWAKRIFASFAIVLRAWIPLCILLACLACQAGCSCQATNQPQQQQILACRAQGGTSKVSPPLMTKTTIPGTIPISFSVTDSGDAALAIPLVVPPGRAGMEPALGTSYNGSSGDGVLGHGFSLSAGSAIARCSKTMAVDGEIRGVQYDADDALCLDGRRLVAVSQSANEIEFRTLPDTQIKVVGHFENAAESYFDALLPTGEVIAYGATPETRPVVSNGVPRAWLASTRRDARGNGMRFDWCFAENEDEGFVAEYALTQIAYTTFGDEEPTRSITFVYGTRDDVQHVYSKGMPFQQSLRLDEIQMHADDVLARRYLLDYAQGETTGRTRLATIEECGADGACKPPTQFQYEKSERGFDKVATNIAVPLSLRASPIFADINGDGLSDWLVPDTTPASTLSQPVTEWRLARNTGNGFMAAKVAFL